MVGERKTVGGNKFYIRSGEKDPSEVVKWAKDTWSIKQMIKSLWDIYNKLCNRDKEKEDRLIKDYFVCNKRKGSWKSRKARQESRKWIKRH